MTGKNEKDGSKGVMEFLNFFFLNYNVNSISLIVFLMIGCICNYRAEIGGVIAILSHLNGKVVRYIS